MKLNSSSEPRQNGAAGGWRALGCRWCELEHGRTPGKHGDAPQRKQHDGHYGTEELNDDGNGLRGRGKGEGREDEAHRGKAVVVDHGSVKAIGEEADAGDGEEADDGWPAEEDNAA